MWIGSERMVLSGLSMIFQCCRHCLDVYALAHTGYPVPLGVDFRGGTEVQVKFAQTPDVGQIRAATVAAASRMPPL